MLPPLQRPTVAALSLSASSRPDWQSLEDIDVPLCQHSLSVSIDEAVHHPLLPCPCPGPLHCSTSCWGLAEQGSHLLLWVSIFTTRRVPLLPEVLAGCATPQHLLHVCPECHSTADPCGDHQVMSAQCGQNSTSQCHP